MVFRAITGKNYLYIRSRAEMHLNPRLRFIKESVMFPIRQMKVTARDAIDV
jgi:hypothetical protein